ncbi:MAG: Ig-like domain-containing protein [Anaerolineae bacterium]|nr:Ig-like domain-containing protein [Anaerolineae bacterium]MDW8172271.1 Ig-like domain-containing protein [Anaerolineae bacterium]
MDAQSLLRHRTWPSLRLAWLALTLLACNLVIGGAPPAPPTPDLPRVQILSPANNQLVYEGADFDLDIVAQDESLGIARVELWVDGVLVNSASPSEATSVAVFRVMMNWLARGVGLHALEAVAYRPDGTRSDSALLTLEVIARPTPGP